MTRQMPTPLAALLIATAFAGCKSKSASSSDGGGSDGGTVGNYTPGQAVTTQSPIEASVEAFSLPGSAKVTGTASAQADVKGTVQWKNAKRISSLIYGVNFHSLQKAYASEAWKRERLASLSRVGGNNFSTYNWLTNASNGGSDGGYSKDWNGCRIFDVASSSCSEKGVAFTQGLSTARAIGAGFMMTIPLMGRIAGTSSSDHISLGNGKESSWGINETYQKNFMDFMATGVKSSDTLLFNLDNEPDGWPSTHDSPTPVSKPTYEELLNKGLAIAKYARGLFPNALLVGPAAMTFDGFMTGGAHLAPAGDVGEKTHGNFAEYYMKGFKEASDSSGKKLLDVFDFHWYPKQKGYVPITSSGRCNVLSTSDSRVSMVLNEPRTLWDDSFDDNAWDTNALGQKKHMIRRLKASSEKLGAGVGVGITEWNLGDTLGRIGMLAAAEALGLFGQEGLTLATYWQLCDSDVGVQNAFRLFRNYDTDNGSPRQFGNVSLPIDGGDSAAQGSVFAATDAAHPGDRITLVAVNKTASTRSYSIPVESPSSLSAARLKKSLVGAEGKPYLGDWETVTFAQNVLGFSLPAYTMALIEVQ